MRRVLNICLFLFIYLLLPAQETGIYTFAERDFKDGVEKIEQHLYSNASLSFETFLKKYPFSLDKKNIQVLRAEAQYYVALCALETNAKNTEILYKKFISEHEEIEKKKRAYYDLGRYYFAHKNYAASKEYYEKIDTKILSKSEQEKYFFEMGYVLYHDKKYDEASDLFDKNSKSEKSPYYADATYYKGMIAYERKDMKQAEKLFVKLKDSEKYKSLVTYPLINIAFQLKKYDQVISYKNNVQAVNASEQIDAKHLIGQSYFEQKKYTDAIPYLAEYMEKKKKVNEEEVFQLAYAYYQTKDYKQAITQLKELSLSENELTQNALYTLANCYLKLNEKEKARSAFALCARLSFDKIIKEESDFNFGKLSSELNYGQVAVNSLKSFVRNYETSTHTPEARKLLTKELLATKNYVEAIEVFDEIKNKTSEESATLQNILYDYAVQLYNDKEYAEAAKYAQKSLQVNVDKATGAQAHLLLGDVLFFQKKYTDAFSSYYESYHSPKKVNRFASNYSDIKALYGMAYSTFMLKDFENAKTQFQACVSELKTTTDQSVKSKIEQDVYTRLADCMFMLKEYENARDNYTEAIETKGSLTDYALLQKSTIEGLQKKYDVQIKTLNALINKYENSLYVDNAQFLLAEAYQNKGDVSEALSRYTAFCTNYPTSSLRSKALLKKGLLQFNSNKLDDALASYKQVVEQYPSSIEATQALTVIKDIYSDKGEIEEYFSYTSALGIGINYTQEQQDSIFFESIEENFAKQDYAKTKNLCTNYITKYPKGKNIQKAILYRAESNYAEKYYDIAITDYEKLIQENYTPYLEKALLKSVFVLYNQKKQYDKAYTYYKRISEITSSPQNLQIAKLGMMRCSFFLNKWADNVEHATKLLLENISSDDLIQEANFNKGKSFEQLNQYDSAEVYLYKSYATYSNDRAAEAMYLHCEILYKKGKLDEALNSSFLLKDNFSGYEYWVIKTYVLIAEIYDKQGDIFQARATLESIVQNYTGDEKLLQEAKDKLKKLDEKAKQNSKVNTNK